MTKTKKLLCICKEFPPQISPTANRSSKILKYLKKNWNYGIEVITDFKNKSKQNNIYPVKSWSPHRIIKLIHKLKLSKLLGWFIWPDDSIFWVIPAILKAKKIIKKNKPDAIVVFMMPYSAGIIGILLKWLTKLPLVLNLDDSPTCTDMHPSFPSWIHYRMTHWLENFYIRKANAIIYVSKFNLKTVQKRHPSIQHKKFYLIRYGIDTEDFHALSNSSPKDTCFKIVYIGGMNGWYKFYHRPEEQTLFKKFYKAWMNLGRYKRAKIDHSTSSPIFIGKAIQKVIAQNPNWKGKIKINIYGNKYPKSVVERVLQNQNLTDVVSVFGLVPHSKAIQIASQADILFITLPDRLDSSAGGRISAKTYEYLMTDKPILAALPKGENWNYLKDKPGVWLVEPTDTDGMVKIISELAAAKFSGHPQTFDRSNLHSQLSYTNRAKKFAKILNKI